MLINYFPSSVSLHSHISKQCNHLWTTRRWIIRSTLWLPPCYHSFAYTYFMMHLFSCYICSGFSVMFLSKVFIVVHCLPILDLEKHTTWVSNGRFSPLFSTASWWLLPFYWFRLFRLLCKWTNTWTLLYRRFCFSWQKLFKSRIAKAFNAGAKYYFNFIICIFGLLFLGKSLCLFWRRFEPCFHR